MRFQKARRGVETAGMSVALIAFWYGVQLVFALGCDVR
jgi:hypothetical protein